MPQGRALPTTASLPGEGYPYWERIKPVYWKKTVYLVIQNRLLSQRTHYVGGTTVPCLLDLAGACEWCGGLRRMYNGFLAVWERGQPQTKILTLTAHAVRKCPGLENGTTLAGREITVWRSGRHIRATQHAALTDEPIKHVEPSKVVQPAFLQRVLLNIWGVEIVEAGPDGPGA